MFCVRTMNMCVSANMDVPEEHMWRSEDNLICLSSPSTLRQYLSCRSPFHMPDELTHELPDRVPCHCFSCPCRGARIADPQIINSIFYMDSRDLNLGHEACTASVLHRSMIFSNSFNFCHINIARFLTIIQRIQ